MSLISLKFFIFIAIVIVAYYICPKQKRWLILLCANIGFIYSSSYGADIQERLVVLLVFIFTTLFSWLSAICISKIQSERKQKLVTTVSIIVLTSILITYKELDFFIINGNILSNLTGLKFSFTAPNWLAPLGISYYTLILIGYLLDVRWQRIANPQKNPLKMLVFSGYFPHMISGPFSRYNDVCDTMLGEVRFSIGNIWFGVQRIIWGAFQVLIISTRLTVIVSNIFNAQSLPADQNCLVGIAIPIGAFLYVLNVYLNFAGSMDIVIGVSEMFGIPLAENFKRPLLATTLSEVWRRWHITLGLWLKDYIMYPTQKALTRKYGSKVRKVFGKKTGKDLILYISMFLLWFCVGFWHGGSWKFICGSGLFFFIMIVGGEILQPCFERLITWLRINTETHAYRLFQRIRTILLFSFSVSFGRAFSLPDGIKMWESALWGLNNNFNSTPYIIINQMFSGLKEEDTILIIGSVFVVFCIHIIQEKYGSIRKMLSSRKVINITLIAILLIFTLWFGGMDGKIDFIYGNF